MNDKPLQQSRDDLPSGRALNFLLVDDDDLCLFIHRRIIELTGCCKSAHLATNGEKAIDFLASTADGTYPVPDMILLDLEMPMMNGLEFLRAFQSFEFPDKSRIAVVLLTSSASEHDKAEALALGAVKCLSKPLTEHALDDVIRLIDEKKLLPSLAPLGTPHNRKP